MKRLFLLTLIATMLSSCAPRFTLDFKNEDVFAHSKRKASFQRLDTLARYCWSLDPKFKKYFIVPQLSLPHSKSTKLNIYEIPKIEFINKREIPILRSVVNFSNFAIIFPTASPDLPVFIGDPSAIKEFEKVLRSDIKFWSKDFSKCEFLDLSKYLTHKKR
jgi:hypothetical protein